MHQAASKGVQGQCSICNNLGRVGNCVKSAQASHILCFTDWCNAESQVVMGDSGSDEDREREQLLRRATGLRGSITRAQDRYGAVMDAFKMAEDVMLGMGPAQQVCLLHLA